MLGGDGQNGEEIGTSVIVFKIKFKKRGMGVNSIKHRFLISI